MNSNMHCYMYVFILILVMSLSRVITWNVRGVTNCTAELKCKLDSCDVLFLSEHWLNDNQKSILTDLHSDFIVYVKCQQNHCSPRGAGGVAMFVRKQDNCTVTALHIPDSDHMIAVRLDRKSVV